MKSKFFFTALLGLISLNTFAQSNGSVSSVAPSGVGNNNGLISTTTRYGAKSGNAEITYEEAVAEYSAIKGSPFLHGKEILVDLVLHNDSIIRDIPIQYDLYNEEIIAKTKKGEQIILDQVYYKGFNYEQEGGIEKYRRINLKKPSKFYRLLFRNEDFIFYISEKISIQTDDRYIPGQESIIKRFLNIKDYYVLIDRKAELVKLRKGALIAHLPEKYQSQVAGLQKKLKIKKLKKLKDYLLLMEGFVELDAE